MKVADYITGSEERDFCQKCCEICSHCCVIYRKASMRYDEAMVNAESDEATDESN